MIYTTQIDANHQDLFYPHPLANAISIRQLLSSSHINLNDIMNTGAIIRVLFNYECNVKKPLCIPKLEFESLLKTGDPPIYLEDALSYDIGGETYRDFMRFIGIRIIFNVKGVGQTMSVPAIILQLSSGLALLSIAAVFTDWIMLYMPLLPETQRKLYFMYKIEDSEDFSNLQEKLDVIDKE